MNLPELGVGLNWFSGLEPVLKANEELIDVLEVEPQAFWRREKISHDLVLDRPAIASLRQRRIPKLIHSVAFPVGGALAPSDADIGRVSAIAKVLGAPWISEHLSFNRVRDESGTWQSGFLLPPRQTLAGVEAAVASVRASSVGLPVPLAIETGVNYLRPRPDELPDGEFVARVAEAADCGILLDLHNIWTNERNGRQSLADYIEQIPIERVWEVHVAGGHSHRGYWLDSHSGAVPAELMELAARIIPRLPNLKAIVFELFASYLPKIGGSAYRPQLEELHRLWERRNTKATAKTQARRDPVSADAYPSPLEWEQTLARLTVHQQCSTPLADELRRDPGLAVIREMVEKFRGSMVVRALRLSSRLIMLERGTAYLEQLLAEFWRTHPPQPFALDEAQGFATFLREHKPYVPFLPEVLDYDCAVIAVALDGEERSVPFGADPMPLLLALGAGRRPPEVTKGTFEIRLTPDLVKADAQALSAMTVIH
ncbi:MAG TPA: DUF692 family protein [Terriglobales bacterium]|nr:DUF692 family protein [Terriglobales bacterium]